MAVAAPAQLRALRACARALPDGARPVEALRRLPYHRAWQCNDATTSGAGVPMEDLEVVVTRGPGR